MNNLIALTCILLVLFKQTKLPRERFHRAFTTPQLTQKMISDAETSPCVQDQMNRQMLTFSLVKTFEDEKNGQTSEDSINLISVDS